MTIKVFKNGQQQISQSKNTICQGETLASQFWPRSILDWTNRPASACGMGRFKTHAEWKQYGRRFGRRPHNPDRLWEVGDWWNEFDLLPPHERRKQTRKSMIEGADWDGPESYAVCKLAGEVARKFPPGVRQLSQLEWTKHEAIKSLPTDLRVPSADASSRRPEILDRDQTAH